MADDDSQVLPGLRVLAHPLRLQLLSMLAGTAMSAAEAARQLGQTQANVSYHLRRLQAAGLLVPAEETVVRGGKAKRYRHPGDSAEHLTGGNPADHQQLAAAMASELVRRARSYRPGTPTRFTDAEFVIRRQDWDEAQVQARRLGELLHNSALEAAGDAGDVGGSDEPPAALMKISATLFLFELLEGREPDDGGPGSVGGASSDPDGGAGSDAGPRPDGAVGPGGAEPGGDVP